MSDLEDQLLFQIRVFQLPTPEREYRFKDGRRWRFDLAFPFHRLAVEVEGGTWVSGRHTRGSGFEKDCEKYAEAAILGWRTIRVTGNMIKDGRAIRYIERALYEG